MIAAAERLPIPSAAEVLACCLATRCDARAIADELDALAQAPWTLHFHTGVFEGAWTGLALRAPGGDPARLTSDLTGVRPIEDTPLRAALPRTDAFLRGLNLPLRAVRFLRLAPGARIRPHRDDDLGIAHAELRLHAVIRTHPEVRFTVDGMRLRMQPGELWYADFSREHAVENPSPVERIHLVIDCEAAASLLDAIARAPAAIRAVSSR